MGRVQGVILAGGASRRFGSDKAFATWNGRPFLRAVADALLEACDDLLILGRSGVSIDMYHQVVPEARIKLDVQFQAGPLIALRNAMELTRAPMVLVAPVDAPGLTGADAVLLVTECRKAKGPVVAKAGPDVLYDLFCGPKSTIEERLKTAKRLEDLVKDAPTIALPAAAGLNVNEPTETGSL